MTSATLSIAPFTTTNVAPPQTAVLTLASSANCSVGTPGSATVTIVGNTVPGSTLTRNGPTPTLSWSGAAGAVYRIAYKNQLTDPNWTYLSGDINGTGALMSWTDTGATSQSQRYYLVVQVR